MWLPIIQKKKKSETKQQQQKPQATHAILSLYGMYWNAFVIVDPQLHIPDDPQACSAGNATTAQQQQQQHTLKVTMAMRVAASRTSMGLSNILEAMDPEMSSAMRILLLVGSTASKLR